MRGDKDDGDLYTCLSQSLLEVEAAHLRQPHIKLYRHACPSNNFAPVWGHAF
jgi:hypothetical protein